MNDYQLYQYYLTMPLAEISNSSKIYPNYVKIMGRSFGGPNPHRHFSFEEFLDKLKNDPKFREFLNE